MLSLWKAEPHCSEEALEKLAAQLAGEVRPNDRICLEGPMGAGKSKFTRLLLKALGIQQTHEGSPTFSIAHEYESSISGIAHLDFYRIKNEDEIEFSGIPSYYWERSLIVISEWLSLWPELEKKVYTFASGRIWRINLSFSLDLATHRHVEVWVSCRENGGGEFLHKGYTNLNPSMT